MKENRYILVFLVFFFSRLVQKYNRDEKGRVDRSDRARAKVHSAYRRLFLALFLKLAITFSAFQKFDHFFGLLIFGLLLYNP